MNKKVHASQKSYDAINFDQAPISAPLIKALIAFTANFRTAVRALFDLTGNVSAACWFYGINFE